MKVIWFQVIDLLNPGSSRKPLQVRWSKESRSFYVENQFTVDCETLDDLFAVLEEGKILKILLTILLRISYKLARLSSTSKEP